MLLINFLLIEKCFQLYKQEISRDFYTFLCCSTTKGSSSQFWYLALLQLHVLYLHLLSIMFLSKLHSDLCIFVALSPILTLLEIDDTCWTWAS